MSRRTEWIENGEWFTGLGQRMLTTDAGDHALLDTRAMVFDAPEQ
jgi:type VI secretion system protein ImpE